MQYVFVEYLTVVGWFCSVLPRLIWARISAKKKGCVYFVEVGSWSQRIVPWMGRKTGIQIHQLKFRADDVLDENGNVVWMRVVYEDMLQVLYYIRESDVFKRFLSREDLPVYATQYLQKQCLPGYHVLHNHSLWRSIYVFQVFCWKIDQDQIHAEQTLVFLRPHIWQKEVIDFAKSRFNGTILTPFGQTELSVQTIRIFRLILGLERRKIHKKIKRFFHRHKQPLHVEKDKQNPLVAGEFWGDLNLDNPEFYSDFFFWQQSSLPGKNVIAIFKSSGSRALTEDRWLALARKDMQAVAVSESANAYIPEVVYDTAPRLLPHIWLDFVNSLWRRNKRYRWLSKEILLFNYETDYWYNLFKDFNIKVYTTWFKYNSEHCIIANAIAQVDGIMTAYQRAYEGLPCAQITLAVDIYFGFSNSGARVEAESLSHIQYHVAVGLMSDHRNDLVNDEARKMRTYLEGRGAKHIVAFYDENSADDARWLSGHDWAQTDYAFWLEKVLEESNFGLILKPKRPATLRQRLGQVVDLLDQALATERCYLYSEDTQGYVTPVQAAKSADVAVHCSLYATTAGMEAALAGIPALIKCDGYKKNPLYQVGYDKFVFDAWADLWLACQDVWQDGGQERCLKAWEPVLYDLDPFRDGRAAERMGTYLHWLVAGFEQGLSRETVMAQAAERYGSLWGWDYVSEVTPCPKHSL